MHRIDGNAHVGNMFSEGDPGVPRLPTQTTEAWLNAVQEEIVGTVTMNGDALVKADNTQLKTIIQALLAGKKTENFCINGAFDFWQRGTAFTSIGTTREFVADRWSGKVAAGASELDISRATGPDSLRYGITVQRAAAGTNVNDFMIVQEVDRDFVRQMRGKRIYLTCMFKNGADFSQAGAPVGQVVYGTGAESQVYGAYTDSTNLLSQGLGAASTSWVAGQLATAGAVLPTTATTMAIVFRFTPTGTAGADDSFSVSGVTLSAGTINASFSRAGGDLAGELAICQRYYEKSYDLDVAPNAVSAVCVEQVVAGSAADYQTGLIPFKVRKVSAPTMTFHDPTGGPDSWDILAGGYTVPSAGIAHERGFSVSFSDAGAADFPTAGGLVQGHWTADSEI